MNSFRSLVASMLISPILSSSVVAQTFPWTGDGATNNWSEGANWFSPSAPGEGGGTNIRLEFALGSSNFTPNNNLAETTPSDPRFGAFQLESMFVAGSSNPYTISGSPLLFAGDASIQALAGPHTINSALRVAVPLEVSASGQIDLNGNLSGTANITKTGGGTLVLDGSNGSWSGDLSINQGTVRFDPGDALSVNSDVHVAAGATADFSPEAEGFGGFSGEGHLNFGNNADMFSHFNNTGTFGGTISGANTHLRKQGPQSLILDGVVAGPANVSLDRLTLETGSINLTPNATLNIDGALTLEPGTILTSSGELNISTFNDVTVQDSAQLRVRTPILGPANIGIETGGTFEVISGATVAIDGGTFIVFSAENLFIDTGGKLVIQNGAAAIVGAGANTSPLLLSLFAELEVSGEGTTWTSPGLHVGDFGTGTLTVSDGGNVSTSSFVGIGVPEGSTGTATVTGEGSTWTVGGLLSIGANGNGSLSIKDGGTLVTTITTGDISAIVGSEDTATITGERSTWTHGSVLLVNGMLTIEAGGSVSTAGALIAGSVSGSTGDVTVTGADSSWTNSFNILVGATDSGTGTLTIEAGGSVSTDGSAIGAVVGSTGTVTVTGIGSLWAMTENLSVGGNVQFSGTGGTGTLNIDPGGTVTVAEDTVLFPDGVLRLQGGTLATSTVSFDGGGQFEWTSGTLHVERFIAPLVNQGGTLAPGLSAGTTTIVGQYTQQLGATLEIEIGGFTPGTEYDVLTIEPLLSSDDALLDGALEVLLIDDFVPALGSTFTIVETTAGNVIGTFADENLPEFDGLTFDVVYNSQSVVLEVIELAGLAGDFNDDGVVNAADYVLWRDLMSDDSARYDTWRTEFGAASGNGSGNTLAVPELSAFFCLVLLSILLLSCGSRARSRQASGL